jgi:hypothetical protein
MGEPKNEAKRRAGGTRRAFTSFKVFFSRSLFAMIRSRRAAVVVFTSMTNEEASS